VTDDANGFPLITTETVRETTTTISDQFAFRPTGSATCALTFFMHHVTRLLEEHSYVRCL